MSEWGKVESKYGREVSNLKRVVKPYDYSQKNANLTDKNLREILISDLRTIKSNLTELMALAYRETDEAANEIKRVRDDIDLSITEIKTLSYWKFPDSQEALEKIFKADAVLFNSLEQMKRSINTVHTQILELQKPSPQINAKFESIRKMVSDFRSVFLERSEVVKIKK